MGVRHTSVIGTKDFVAKNYVHTDDLAILVVGRAADFPKSRAPCRNAMIVTVSVSTRYIGRQEYTKASRILGSR